MTDSQAARAPESAEPQGDSLAAVFGAHGEGSVVSFDGKHASVVSPISSPPGSILRARLPGVGSEFQLKVHGCKKQPGEPSRFLVSGRVQNATRELLDVLRQLLPA